MPYRDNLSAEEQFRIFGSVQGDALVQLLDEAALAEGTCGAAEQVQEAMACFPDEDFLEAEILELREWAKSKRGQNKAEFLDLIDRINKTMADMRASADHGLDELKKARNTLIGAE